MIRFFERLVDPYTPYQETDRPPERLWPFLRSFAGPFRLVFCLAILAAAAVAVTEIWLIWYLGRLTDTLGSASPDVVLREYWVEFLAVALFILIARPLIQILNEVILNHGVGVTWGTLIRWRIHRHVMRQSVGWFENDFAGRIANRVMQTPSAANEVAFQVFDAVAYAIAYSIGAAVLLAAADPRLLLPLLGWIGLYCWLMQWSVKRVGPRSKAASAARSKLNGRLVDGYTNIHSIKMFAHHDQEIAYAKEAIEEVKTTFSDEMRVYTWMNSLLVALNGLLIVGVVGWAIGLYLTNQSSVGIVVAASALVLRLNAMTGWIMWAVTNLFQQLGIVAEGMESVSTPIDLVDRPDAQPLRFQAGQIEIDALSHRFGRQTGGIENVSLTIEPGEKVGLVGRSGAGKSTLIKLILRFYDAEGGTIRLDGQDIAGVSQDSLRSQIGVVQQEAALLHRSVWDNIIYGRPDASENDVITAANRAEASDFIETLADGEGRTGYDAHVGERGVKLSGGQRQRIALARVILKDAPILLLDEATSALDSEVEAAIQNTLYGLMEGKTVIAIAHRLSTIAQMDRIVVMDEGRIVEEGTHDALLALDGLYARLWTRQSGGFIGVDETEAAE